MIFLLIELDGFIMNLSFFPEKCGIYLHDEEQGEGFIYLVWVLYGHISSGNTQKSDLFLTQVDFMLFLRFWDRSIQALPNPVRCLPNFGILFLNPPNMYGKPKKRINDLRNHILSLIFHLPIDSSPWFSMKNKVF